MSSWDTDPKPFLIVDGKLIHRSTGLTVNIPLREHLAGKHDQKRHAGGRGAARSAGLEAALASNEDRIRHIKGGEEAVLLDADGRVIFTKRAFGDPDGDGPASAGVTFGKHEYREFKGRVLTHNHPGSALGLSTDDISTAVNDEMAEIRSVMADGTVFSLRPGKTTWNAEHLAKVAPVWDKHFKAVDDANRSAIRQAWSRSGREGIYASQRASDTVFHETLSRVAPEVGWDYQVIRR